VLTYLGEIGLYSAMATFDCPMVEQYRRA